MENYEEKYKNALSQAKQAINNIPDKSLAKWLQNIFPELKESDDERIRKTLKSFFDAEISDYGNVEWRNGIMYGEIVAWLEKQGEQKPSWSEEDERHKNTIIRAIHGAGNITPIDGELAENWLKSLKERMKGK